MKSEIVREIITFSRAAIQRDFVNLKAYRNLIKFDTEKLMSCTSEEITPCICAGGDLTE